MRARGTAVVLAIALTACHARPFYEQSYLRSPQNWALRNRYPLADHMLNAFDYGHAILYETLIAHPVGADSVLEGTEFPFITGHLLDAPPTVPLDEGAVGPHYVQLVPEVRAMFDWAHALHKQLYDIWADSRVPDSRKDALVSAALARYRSRGDLAFSAVPKQMSLMEGQPYSRAFRERCPKFNGLIWSYHWMQMALYEGLLSADNDGTRGANVAAVLRRFRAMHPEAPARLPSVMPMTAAVAPRFAARYPEAAIIFDNMHAMHDVVSDVLASARVPVARRRETILRAAAAYRDDTTAVTTVAAWREMSAMMGAERMGGAWIPERR